MIVAVSEIKDDGLVVELVNGSSWLINPADWNVTINWLPGQRIEIKEGIGNYSLTNVDSSRPVTVTATKPRAII